jgi:glycosyltransferase involved in cell wall biosynthesis
MGHCSLSDKNVVVVTHSFSTGPPQELKRFLSDKVKKLLYISHPFSYCEDVRSSMEFYEKGVKTKESHGPPMKGPDPFFYFKDVVYTILYTLRTKTKYDIYIGADNLNALSGLILRKIGRVDTVIFYTIDYVPKRFEGALLNKIYHVIDRMCCYYCNCVWNISDRIAEARFANGVRKERSTPQIVVPNGSNFDEIKRLPIEKINRFRITFMGHLRKNQGVELILKAFPGILKRVPAARLEIVGTGPLEAALRRLTHSMGLGDKVNFVGFVEDHSELEKILTRCAIGLAPYVPSPDSFTYFADPGKPKTYLAAGLPVVITNVPVIASEINARKAGILIDFDERQLSEAIVTLLSDDVLYREYRENAIALGSLFDWNSIFREAFERTFAIV